MRHLVLALLLVTSPALSGCLSEDQIGNLYDDLEVKDKFESHTLLLETTPFSPTGTAEPEMPNGTEDVGQTWQDTFQVPNGTQRITIVFDVTFSTPDEPDPVPVNAPQGDLDAYVYGPDREQNNSRTFTQSADVKFGFNDPDEGEWTAGFEARGNGSVRVAVTGVVPVNASVG
jgi:hypothetical protein